MKFGIENKQGQKLNLTNNPNYSLSEITGLNPPSATISMSEVPNFDGAKLNATRVNYRTIEIYLYIESPAEANRLELYRFCKSKQYIKVYYKSELRDVFIEGYVQDFTISYFEMKQLAQIVIACPAPFFNDMAQIVEDSNIIINNFTFPFSIPEEGIEFGSYEENLDVIITNEGEVESGLILEFRARSGEVVNPKVINRDTLEYFGLNYTMEEGDLITINTSKGNKSVVLTRDGVNTNLFNYILSGSTWLQLQARYDNYFTYESTTGLEHLDVRFIHRNLFEGV